MKKFNPVELNILDTADLPPDAILIQEIPVHLEAKDEETALRLARQKMPAAKLDWDSSLATFEKANPDRSKEIQMISARRRRKLGVLDDRAAKLDEGRWRVLCRLYVWEEPEVTEMADPSTFRFR